MSAVASSPAAGRRPAPQNRLQRMLTSSIGLKISMALTGVVLSGFVLVHMLGNLQIFQGAEAIDAYGKLLRKEPALLWLFRFVLLGAVLIHIWAYLTLTRKNRQARPVGYQTRNYKESSFASRSMAITGPLILAFIIYHILHLTTGTAHPDFHEGAVYHNVVYGLKGLVGVIYIAAMIMLAFHLWHGVWSMFQTLGAPEDRYGSLGRRFATIFTILVTIGFAAVPLAVLAGYLKPALELKLMSWGDGSGVPTSGQHLVIVGADNNSLLHIRIFDVNGNRVTDTDELKLPNTEAGSISTLKKQLPGLQSHELSGDEKTQVITEVGSIVGQTLK